MKCRCNAPEFYATYRLLNIKNHRQYSEKFTLSVVDLTHIELATEEDRTNQIDYWAKLFTATSWEELKMIAENNTSMSEATQTLYELNADMITQEKCRARREYYRRQNTMNRDMAILQSEISKKEVELAEKTEELAKKDEKLAEAEAQNAKLQKQLEELQKQLDAMK